MPCVLATAPHAHREHEVYLPDFAVSHLGSLPGPGSHTAETVPLAVTKLLERSEVYSHPGALDAVKLEGQELLKAGTWLLDTVIEKDALVAQARRKGEKIHLGDLMSICSVKFWERDPEYHKVKGRITFRGDTYCQG